MTLTPRIGLTVALAALLPAAAAHAQAPLPTATATTPGASIVATSSPVPLDVRVTDGDLTIASANVVVTDASGKTVEYGPLAAVGGDPGHFTGGLSSAAPHWASVPGSYAWAVEVTPAPVAPTPTPVPPRPCPPLPRPMPEPATDYACPQGATASAASLAVLREATPHPLKVVAALDARAARSHARAAAAKIGWKRSAPVRCVAPYVPSAFACTLTWHRDHRQVVRRLLVSQDPTGAISVKR